jgi:hypothetical protein
MGEPRRRDPELGLTDRFYLFMQFESGGESHVFEGFEVRLSGHGFGGYCYLASWVQESSAYNIVG